ncbi:molybdenum cofactor biosynthesis protein MoaE [Pullulanibacillus camelliae]|nr:molybdenum cofactor biosynthesis protein MoaE [Pullulanibacillus camelliae]
MFQITDHPILIEEVTQKVLSHEAGAVVNFIGTVREFTGGKQTLALEYESYVSMAEKQLRKIGREIVCKWPEARIAITHRVGHLQISDIAVVIAVSTPHRNDAYEANQYAIERIKQIVPIWKKEYWQDGTEWIGNQQETISYPSGKPEDVIFND